MYMSIEMRLRVDVVDDEGEGSDDDEDATEDVDDDSDDLTACDESEGETLVVAIACEHISIYAFFLH